MGTYVTDVYGEEFTPGRRRKVRPVLGLVTEPAREVPVLHDVDVLVVGGGPAGTTAAISAARLGARVMLVERYNHLGGLSTGGLVIWIDRMTDWDGKLVIRGLGEELLDRLPADAKSARSWSGASMGWGAPPTSSWVTFALEVLQQTAWPDCRYWWRVRCPAWMAHPWPAQ